MTGLGEVSVLRMPVSNSVGVAQAFARTGSNVTMVDSPKELPRVKRLVLPGVGNFGSAALFLKSSGLLAPVREIAKAGIPILGICLGMHLLAESSEESPGESGLGAFSVEVTKLRTDSHQQVPNVGWRDVKQLRGSESNRLTSLRAYFSHSYFIDPSNFEEVWVTAPNSEVTALIRQANILGVQFHPEKSHEDGLRVLYRFASWNGDSPWEV